MKLNYTTVLKTQLVMQYNVPQYIDIKPSR